MCDARRFKLKYPGHAAWTPVQPRGQITSEFPRMKSVPCGSQVGAICVFACVRVMSDSAPPPPPQRLLVVSELVTWQRSEKKTPNHPQTTGGSSHRGQLKSRFAENSAQKGQRPLQVRISISRRLKGLCKSTPFYSTSIK